MSAADTVSDLAKEFEESLQRTLGVEAVGAQAALMGAVSVCGNPFL
jgi:hypothetical protein